MNYCSSARNKKKKKNRTTILQFELFCTVFFFLTQLRETTRLHMWMSRTAYGADCRLQCGNRQSKKKEITKIRRKLHSVREGAYSFSRDRKSFPFEAFLWYVYFKRAFFRASVTYGLGLFSKRKHKNKTVKHRLVNI